MSQAARAAGCSLRGSLRRGLVAEWLLNGRQTAVTGNGITVGDTMRRHSLASSFTVSRLIGTAGLASVGGGHFVATNHAGASYTLADVVGGKMVSIEAWAKAPANAYGQLCVVSRAAPYIGFWFRAGANTSTMDWFSNQADSPLMSTAIPNDGRFHQIAMRQYFDGAGYSIETFIDGARAEVRTGTALNAASSIAGCVTNIGSDTILGGAYTWGSPIASVRLWNRSITPSEVRAMYAIGPHSASRPSLLFRTTFANAWLPSFMSRRSSR